LGHLIQLAAYRCRISRRCRGAINCQSSPLQCRANRPSARRRLTDPRKNLIFNMSVEEARRPVAERTAGERPRERRAIALVAVDGPDGPMARSIGRTLRYSFVQASDGPSLIAADRIGRDPSLLVREGLEEQFHPVETRMAPAHYITEIALGGCPDPNPPIAGIFEKRAQRSCQAESWNRPRYIGGRTRRNRKMLQTRAINVRLGVLFWRNRQRSIFLLTYHTILEAGLNPRD